MRLRKWFAIGIVAVLSLSLVGSIGAGPVDNPGKGPPQLEKKIFIHYKKDFAKPPDAGKGAREAACYDFMAKGLKWKTLPASYVIDSDNEDGLTQAFIVNAINLSAAEWDFDTSAGLFGTYTIDQNASWDGDNPDGRNELVFDNYSDGNVIAITVVWGYFSVPPPLRAIVEFDVMFDTDFVWGDATKNESVMDLQNIATHELGHGIGLADVYETKCSTVTMYGYSWEGDVGKRTLEPADITGLQQLYGK